MSSAVRTYALTKRFRRAFTLDDVHLDIPEGSVFGLVGPNGAGKTTTLKILMNMLRPTAGRAEVLGTDSRRLAAADFARIGYVSENQELPDWMTLDYLLAYLRPFYPTWDDALAASLVRRFGLPRDRKLRHFSRGMWMKASLASSLAYRPRLLILDEPFGGLDPLIREDLIGGILDRAGESTILVSSHDLADIETFVTHIGFLDGGRLHFAEEMDRLAARFREVQVVLDPPARLPANGNWPDEWLQPAASHAAVRFVDTHYEPGETARRVQALFPGVRQISAEPMPLRAIFIALARRSARGREAGAS